MISIVGCNVWMSSNVGCNVGCNVWMSSIVGCIMYEWVVM